MRAVKAGFLVEVKGASGQDEASQAHNVRGTHSQDGAGVTPGTLLATRPAPSSVRLQHGPSRRTRVGLPRGLQLNSVQSHGGPNSPRLPRAKPHSTATSLASEKLDQARAPQ